MSEREGLVFIAKKKIEVDKIHIQPSKNEPDKDKKDEYITFLENIYDDVIRARHKDLK